MSPGATRYVHGEIDALPPGTRLAEFEVLRVLGMGGFGIVYLALDTQLQRQVALKEYLPASMASRSESGNVSVRSRIYADTFSVGLRSFVNEARLLARFDNPSLVKVHRFWEANGTAYMVMPYYDGATLKAVRQSMNSPPDEAWLRRVLDSLLGALEVMHAASIYHRDVAPDNILLLRSGQPVLLDFGAARHVLLGQTQTLTAVLKPAYAPIEQYAEASEFRQGPWTDIYATAATLHYCLTGRAPPTAAARAVHDNYQPLRLREDLAYPAAGRACDPAWLAALDWGLEVKPQARPQSIAEWREVLSGRAPIPVVLSLPQPDPETTIRTSAHTLRPQTGHGPASGAAAAPAATAALRGNGGLGPGHATPAGVGKRLQRPAAGQPSFRQMLPWILWVLAAMAVAGAAVYFNKTGGPPLPMGNLGLRSNPPLPPGAIDESASLIPPAASVTQVVAEPPQQAAPAGQSPVPTEAAPSTPGAAATVPEPAVTTAPPPVAASPPRAAVAAAGSGSSASGVARGGSRPLAGEPTHMAAASADSGSGSGSGSAQPRSEPERAERPARPERSEPPRTVAARRSAPAEPAGPSSPREACGNRILISLWSCMRENCASNRWIRHPQCVEWHRMEQANSPQN